MADETACPLRTTLIHGDCLEVMPALPAQSVQFVFADLPYNATNCRWDQPLDVCRVWGEIARILAEDGTLCATATFRFAVALFSSAKIRFRYDLIWHKTRSSGFLNAKKAPLRSHEHVLVFSDKGKIYNPQMWQTDCANRQVLKYGNVATAVYGKKKSNRSYTYTEYRLPLSVIKPSTKGEKRGMHPTQKPVALLEWLIKTYTNPGDTVLDPVMGSATTGVACLKTGRHFVGIEKDATYFDVARKRVDAERAAMGLPPADCR